MILPRNSNVITRERMINTRWTWAELHGPPLTKSFYFGSDGLIKVWSHRHEKSWAIEAGIVKIYDDGGKLMWSFDIALQFDGRLTLISKSPRHFPWDTYFCLTEYVPEARSEDAEFAPEDGGGGSGDNEGIRLVIWDLDDTFWHGTISETAVTVEPRNVEIVKELTRRGIINSICSKNDPDVVKTKLEELGVWENFVFPEVSWNPKGAMLKNIVRNAQLRAETVMFIDDNETNLNEAKFYVPKLQVADTSFIPGLLDDPRFAGKPDPESTRLARYKILETKLEKKAASNGDNIRFLRESEVRVSFHTDVLDQFARVHELVNRTNQLNFTKNRWPEDINEARALYLREAAQFDGYDGYVKVADRYGKYGICGFYMVHMRECQHFLFSCRAMDMGIEQFVWSRLGRPCVRISGEVISDLDASVDWVSVVDDADGDAAPPVNDFRKATKVCIRGACDMSMLSNFLRTQVETKEEVTFAYQGWEICSLPRIAALHEELQRPENQEIVARLPGMPPGRFDSDINVGACDVFVLSFSQESFHGQYRSKRTGMVIPMGHFSLGHLHTIKMDYTKLSYEDILARGVENVSRAQWEFLTNEFDFLGGFDPQLFTSDLTKIFGKLTLMGKHVIIVGLNEQIGKDKPILAFFSGINSIVEPMARAAGFDYIDVNRFITGLDDLAPDGGGPHFSRQTYFRLSEEVKRLIRLRSVALAGTAEATMCATATKGSISDWREEGAQVRLWSSGLAVQAGLFRPLTARRRPGGSS